MNLQMRAAAPSALYRRQKVIAVLTAVLLLIGSLSFARMMSPEKQPVIALLQRPSLVIDPGHGGVDGGAIAYNGVKESELNLQICLKLQALAEFCGVHPVMTRQDENLASNLTSYSEREDLAYRASLAEAAGGVLISVHQNTFPTSQPTGAQVLYGAGEDSRRLGELTHRNLLQALQPENRRMAAPAPSNLYLTSHVSCPAILVECGFLSNLSDLQRLSDGRYQSSLALILLASYLQFTDTAGA